MNGQVPIILDSGIQRGTDIALALGAGAVAVDRPLMYWLAHGCDCAFNGLSVTTHL